MLEIEVIFTLEAKQRKVKLLLTKPCSLIESVELSGIKNLFPEYDFIGIEFGIWSEKINDPNTYFVKHGDRIEIYRPLLI